MTNEMETKSITVSFFVRGLERVQGLKALLLLFVLVPQLLLRRLDTIETDSELVLRHRPLALVRPL